MFVVSLLVFFFDDILTIVSFLPSNHMQDLFLCNILQIVVCPFLCLLLTIVLSVPLRFTDSDYPIGIFKLFLSDMIRNKMLLDVSVLPEKKTPRYNKHLILIRLIIYSCIFSSYILHIYIQYIFKIFRISSYYTNQKSWKIPKRQSKVVNRRRTYNTMV